MNPNDEPTPTCIVGAPDLLDPSDWDAPLKVQCDCGGKCKNLDHLVLHNQARHRVYPTNPQRKPSTVRWGAKRSGEE